MEKRVFNPYDYDENVAMYCETREESDIFRQWLHAYGLHWSSGRGYDTHSRWSPYRTCYRFLRGTIGDYRDYITDPSMSVLRFSDFDWSGSPNVTGEETELACDDTMLDAFLSGFSVSDLI